MGELIVRYHTKMVYPKIYRPQMGTRGTFFIYLNFLPFCFHFLIRFKTCNYFWAYQFFSFFFSYPKKLLYLWISDVSSAGIKFSSASTLSTTCLFPLPLLTLPSFLTLPCLAAPPPAIALPCLLLSCLILSCLVLSYLVVICLVLSCRVSCLLSCLVLSCVVLS